MPPCSSALRSRCVATLQHHRDRGARHAARDISSCRARCCGATTRWLTSGRDLHWSRDRRIIGVRAPSTMPGWYRRGGHLIASLSRCRRRLHQFLQGPNPGIPSRQGPRICPPSRPRPASGRGRERASTSSDSMMAASHPTDTPSTVGAHGERQLGVSFRSVTAHGSAEPSWFATPPGCDPNRRVSWCALRSHRVSLHPAHARRSGSMHASRSAGAARHKVTSGRGTEATSSCR